MFGVFGIEEAYGQKLVREWADIHPEVYVISWPTGVLGCMRPPAFVGYNQKNVGIYRTTSTSSGLASVELTVSADKTQWKARWTRPEKILHPTYSCNAAEVLSVKIMTEISGTYPLYIWNDKDTWAVSTLLRPLARAAGVGVDCASMLEFLKFGHISGDRTVFQNVRRLSGGAVFSCSELEGVTVAAPPGPWMSDAPPVESVQDAADLIIPKLRATLANSARTTSDRRALMMSAGWDSRTLLSVILSSGDNSDVIAYSHGDVRSRELKIAESVCHEAGMIHTAKEIDERFLRAHGYSDEAFQRCESAIFPHWIASGQALREQNIGAQISGVYGEILGGHYGEAASGTHVEKAMSYLRNQSGFHLGKPTRPADRHSLASALYGPLEWRPWYLTREMRSQSEVWNEENLEVVASALRSRYMKGGEERGRVIERYMAEQRGAQYINMQARSAGVYCPEMMPFIEKDLVTAVWRVPLSVRIHNRLNQEIIRRLEPSLLRVPMAATLLAAGRPLPLQEASRVLRKVWQWGHGSTARLVGGDTKLRLGWANFDFLSSGFLLTDMVKELESDYWDKDRLMRKCQDMEKGSPEVNPHHIYDQMGKIRTVDKMISAKA